MADGLWILRCYIDDRAALESVQTSHRLWVEEVSFMWLTAYTMARSSGVVEPDLRDNLYECDTDNSHIVNADVEPRSREESSV